MTELVWAAAAWMATHFGIATERNSFRPREIGVRPLGGALGLYALLYWGHRWIAGVPVAAG